MTENCSILKITCKKDFTDFKKSVLFENIYKF